MNEVRIRRSMEADAFALARLAGLDSRNWEGGEALVAEVCGELWAAIPLDGGAPMADPFRRTGDLVDLLELRRDQLARAPANSRRPAGRRLLRSPARA